MKISCIIVDDEPLARKLLLEYINKIPVLECIGECSGAMEAMEIVNSRPVDLLFLDIHMPGLTGISLLKVLQKKPLIVFTTAYSEYALEGYELDIVDYLLKPVTLERFLKTIDKVCQRLQGPENSVALLAQVPGKRNFVFVKDGNKLIRIQWEDIQYIEGLKDYVIIHTNNRKVISLQRMKILEKELPEDEFLRVHNSFIIALKKIDTIYKDQVQIGQVMIPVGETYKKVFRQYIERNHIN